MLSRCQQQFFWAGLFKASKLRQEALWLLVKVPRVSEIFEFGCESIKRKFSVIRFVHRLIIR